MAGARAGRGQTRPGGSARTHTRSGVRTPDLVFRGADSHLRTLTSKIEGSTSGHLEIEVPDLVPPILANPRPADPDHDRASDPDPHTQRGTPARRTPATAYPARPPHPAPPTRRRAPGRHTAGTAGVTHRRRGPSAAPPPRRALPCAPDAIHPTAHTPPTTRHHTPSFHTPGAELPAPRIQRHTTHRHAHRRAPSAAHPTPRTQRRAPNAAHSTPRTRLGWACRRTSPRSALSSRAPRLASLGAGGCGGASARAVDDPESPSPRAGNEGLRLDA